MREGHDAGIDKSREEGASEICAKLGVLHILLIPGTHGIIGSRNANLVDCKGNPTTIFAKIDHAINHLPRWLRSQLHIDRKEMLLNILETDGSIAGETTNESFSAGSRSTWMVLDEFGRVIKRAADAIEGSIHDVTNCVIYSSTHWYGAGHTFNVCLQKPSTKVVRLLWYDNPEKNKFLYASPQPGFVELKDIKSYKEHYPGLFKYTKETVINVEDLPEEYRKLFIADGCTAIPGSVRSPWHDEREQKSKGNKRDFLCNIWATAIGSSDSVFDQQVLLSIKGGCKEPTYSGEIIVPEGKIDLDEMPEFWEGYGLKRLQWWGKLESDEFGNVRPDQRHNYILGCDPSFGRGSSNSVVGIVDVNEKTLVGLWACSNTKEYGFADQVVALALWCGGVEDAFIIWENNGANGQNFGERIIWQEWTNVYTQTIEDTKQRKKQKRFGWRSNSNTKGRMLGEFSAALANGLDENNTYKSIKVYCYELLDELFDYIFLENSDMSLSSKADLTTGARERHGDRVIAVGLCVLGMKDQAEGDRIESRKVPYGSFQFYYEQFKKQQETEKRQKRRYLF